MSIERIELRKKYYDGNMVREAVMSVTDDYNTILKLLKAFSNQPPLTDVIEVVRCKDCKHFYVGKFANGCFLDHDENVNSLPPDFFCADGERKGEDDDTD